MNRRSVLTFAVLLFFTVAFGGTVLADTARALFDSAQERYEKLLSSEKRRSSKSMWLEVVNAFDRVVRECPSSDEAPLALFTEGCLYREMFNYSITLGELNQAEKIFKRFLQRYPAHRLAPDAKKNIEAIEDQKKHNNLVRVSIEKPSPQDFPGRDEALKSGTDKKTGVTDTAKKGTTPPANVKKDTEKKASPAPGSTVASVEKIRYFTDTTYTRVVVDLDADVSYDDGALPKDDTRGTPPRIYVDLFDACPAGNLYSPLVVKDGLVSRIRWSKNKDRTVRVVLDLERGAQYKVFCLVKPNRLVIDVLRD